MNKQAIVHVRNTWKCHTIKTITWDMKALVDFKKLLFINPVNRDKKHFAFFLSKGASVHPYSLIKETHKASKNGYESTEIIYAMRTKKLLSKKPVKEDLKALSNLY